MAGPFFHPPHIAFISSPLGVIPKTESGSFRVIHHLLYPKGQAVNDLILQELCLVLYEDFDNLSSLAKVDIRAVNFSFTNYEAYRVQLLTHAISMPFRSFELNSICFLL